jgi:hypothetical protein
MVLYNYTVAVTDEPTIRGELFHQRMRASGRYSCVTEDGLMGALQFHSAVDRQTDRQTDSKSKSKAISVTGRGGP